MKCQPQCLAQSWYSKTFAFFLFLSHQKPKKKHLFIFLLDLNTPPKRWCLLLLAAFCKLHEPRVSGSFILPVATLKVSTMPSTQLYVLQQSY